MPRHVAKTLKQSFAAATDDAQRKTAALALLRHSLDLGHRKLSLRRLEEAMRCGAPVEDDDLHRCAELALRVGDQRVHTRLADLSRLLATTRASGSTSS